jgi:hypothetical protein
MRADALLVWHSSLDDDGEDWTRFDLEREGRVLLGTILRGF